MRLKIAALCLIAGLALVVPAPAQEGHPLSGTWLGEWGPKDDQQITIVMTWDAKTKAMKGQFNPGVNHMPIVAILDSSKWTVHIESDLKDDDGKITHIVADGKLENIGSYKRTITGTWKQGTANGNFKLERS